MIEQLQKLYKFFAAPVGTIANRKRLQNLIEDLFEENKNIVDKINECIEQLNGQDSASINQVKENLEEVTRLAGQLNDYYELINLQLEELSSSKANKTELEALRTQVNDKVSKSTATSVDNINQTVSSDFDIKKFYQLEALSKLFKNNIRNYYYEKAKTLEFETYEDICEKCERIYFEVNARAESNDMIRIDVSNIKNQLIDDNDDPIPVLIYVASDNQEGDTIIHIENDIGFIADTRDLISGQYHSDFGIMDFEIGGYGTLILINYAPGTTEDYIDIICDHIGEANYTNISIFKLPYSYE